MKLARRKQLLAAALLVAFDSGVDGSYSTLDLLPLSEGELVARWRRLRSRVAKTYWLDEAARVLCLLEVGGK